MKKLYIVAIFCLLFGGGISSSAEPSPKKNEPVKKEYRKDFKKKKSFRKNNLSNQKRTPTVPLDGGLTFFFLAAGAAGISFLKKDHKALQK